MSKYLTKTEQRTYRACQFVLMAVGAYAAFSVVTARAETLRITMQPPTVVGIEKPPVADYRPVPTLNYRYGPALVVDLPYPAPPNGCDNQFREVRTGRCFGNRVMR